MHERGDREELFLELEMEPFLPAQALEREDADRNEHRDKEREECVRERVKDIALRGKIHTEKRDNRTGLVKDRCVSGDPNAPAVSVWPLRPADRISKHCEHARRRLVVDLPGR